MRYYAVIDSAQRPHFHERLDRLGATYCSLFDEQAEESLTEIAALLVACDRSEPTSRLALQLRFIAGSESMGLHDSEVVDNGCINRDNVGTVGIVAA